MAGKIIIDGIDVSECDYRYGDECSAEYSEFNNEIESYAKCSDCKDCYFKKLKQAEQKLEKALHCINKCVLDFKLEIGTPYYNELLDNAKELGLIKEQ